MISFMLGVAPLLGEARRGIFRTNSGLPLRRNMTYRVYARWPGQRTTHKTTTPYKSVAEAAWDELTSVSWPKDNKPIGLSYTHDGKQLDYVDLEKLDDGQ